jgi:hypothetical protein
MEEADEAVELVERVAALDIGKATLTCCIRIPHETNPARRGTVALSDHAVRLELSSKSVDEPWHENAAYLPP